MMSDFNLTRTRIGAGVYQGLLTMRGRGKSSPELEMRILDKIKGEVILTPHAKAKRTWDVQISIPSMAINEGVQTFIITDVSTGQTLDSFAMITGTPLQEDLHAEMALLRAELDILKHAFRSHSVKMAI